MRKRSCSCDVETVASTSATALATCGGNQNHVEAMVWEELRGRKLKGFKFCRQHPFGNYLADFYCAEAALVVEFDGSSYK